MACRPRPPRGEGSTPLWPRYVPEKYAARTLAILRSDGSLLTEHGEVCPARTFAETTEALYTLDALAFAGRIEEAVAEWLPEILSQTKESRETREHHQWCELLVSPNSQQIIGVAIHRHPKVRKIMWSGTWGNAKATPELLRDLRDLFTLCRVGDHATPGALGHAKMVSQWKGKEWVRHHRPPMALVTRMQNEAVGARRETYAPDTVFTEAWELDRTNGYAAEVHQLPLGTTRYIKNATRWLLPDKDGNIAIQPWAWWGKCRVQIKEDLPPGTLLPLAVWNEEAKEWDWPTRAGWYDCYLWSFEAHELDRLRHEEAVPVMLWSVSEAWYWDSFTTQLSEWAQDMDALRYIAKGPQMNRPEVANLIKCAIVAAIGRLGIEYARYSVVPEDAATPEDKPVVSPEMPETGLYLRREFVDQGTPKHWQCYILARMNFNIYQKMRELQAAGHAVAAVNTDGVWLGEDPEQGVEPAAARLGEYKRRYHGDYLAVPARGIALSPDKITTPGMPLAERQRIMRYGEARRPEVSTFAGMQRARQSASGELHAGARDTLERLRRYYLQAEPGTHNERLSAGGSPAP